MNISDLVWEVTDSAHKTVNAKDRRDLLYHIVHLETAWESGESTKAKRHALSILSVAKKYSKKSANRNRFSDASIQLLESISTGNYVQQRRASSAPPDLAFKYSSSEQHTQEKKKYDEPQKKHDEMWNRISNAERSLKLMFHRVTNHEYSSSGQKVGQGNANPVDLQLLIDDIGERLVDYIRIAHWKYSRKANTRIVDEAKRLYQACTGNNALPSKMAGSQDDTSTVDLITHLLQQEFKALSKQLSHEERRYDKLQKKHEEMCNRLQFLSAKKKTIEQLNDELCETLKGLAQELSEVKNKYEQLEKEIEENNKRFLQQLSKERNLFKNEKDEMHRRLSEQLIHEKRQYEELEKEKDELLNRMSEELSHVKKLFGKTDIEKDEYLNRLSQHLCEERNNYEQLKSEKEEMHHSLLEQLGQERNRYDKLQKEKDDLLNSLSEQLSQEKKTCEGLRLENNELLNSLPYQSSELQNKYDKLNNEKDGMHKSLSHQLSVEKNKYKTLKTETVEMYQRLSGQLSHEKEMYMKIEAERDELLNRLQQLTEEKNTHEALENEKEEVHKRLLEQLNKERNKFEKAKNEQHETHRRLKEQLDHDKRQYEKLGKEKDELLNSLSHQLSVEKNKYKTLKTENDEMYQRFSEQLCEERNKSEKLKNETAEVHRRLSYQISELQNKYGKLKNKKDGMHKRIKDAEKRLKDMFRNVTKQEYAPDLKKDNRKGKQSKSVDLKQLVGDIESRFEDYTRKMTDEKIANEAIRMYEMCTGEKYKLSKQPTVDSIAQLLKQKLDSDGMVSGRKATDDEQQESDDMVAGRKPRCEGRQDTDDMVAGRKPTCTGRQETLSDQRYQLKRQYDALDQEKDEQLNRLPQHVSAKLTKDNKDITDLSDIYGPTKLGEMYSELYDNEWTDAYELLTETFDEKEAIKILIDVLTISYSYCLRHSKTQHMLVESLLILPVTTVSVIEQPSEEDLFERMTQSVLTGRQPLGDIEQKLMVDLGKATKGMSVDNVVKEGVNAVLSRWEITDPSDHFRFYVQQCLRICWFMCQQSPRMFIEVDIAKNSGATFDKSTFKEYLKTGKNIDYVVWLPLFLHEGGNLIRKGVANGK